MDLAKAIKKAKRVFLIGNGGSAANAMHIANDLVGCGIKAQALTDISTLTAIANDFGYEHVFSRQIEVFGEAGDLLIALSGSGKSPNILAAIEAAERKGMDCHLVTDYLRTRDMQQSEEDQLLLGHELMKCLKDS